MIFAMRLYLIALAIVLLATQFSGCTTMTQAAKVDTSTVTWLKQKPTECGGKPQSQGCAWSSADYKRCVITMPVDAPDWVVAEEFKHCFGFEHI